MLSFKNLIRNAAIAGVMSTPMIASAASTFIGDRTDFRDETIYFAMTTRFYDGDSSNNTYCWDGTLNDAYKDPEWRGDFKGLIEKMDYIKALGFTAIWITPIVENASGLDYHGYHAINFSKVDPRYESSDVKFQNVIDEAHKRGMKVILDVVLQHTGNFGETNLCPMFTKDYTSPSNHKKNMRIIRNGKLPDNYWDLPGGQQHDARLDNMKNRGGKGQDPMNYWHHVGQAWDWDDYSRVWGQIAGDCVDLNTENPHVYNYLVDCYSKFIEMGVDGFRIDTTGHIARLTFNKAFIPRFQAAAEKAKAKRGGTPFYMFGECCAVAEEVIYRNGNYNCSPCFYTWAESKNYAWDESEASWEKNIPECDPSAYNFHVNTASVLAQAKDYEGHADAILQKSNNAWLNGNEYHTPDYSKSSGFNVIDFPIHQRFHTAANAFGVNSQDNLYNDATWNVVYIDSHDYGPNGFKVDAFNKEENVWAENLSLMFTFRGIPCIFQGTESRFRRTGGYVIDKGTLTALHETLRAYYGGYLTGSVNTTDFAQYSNATGNMAATLSQPLAQHLMRLNKIRAAVPALRKGQYSTSGCSGSMAFKRRYKDANTDSYVLVTVSGDATFSNILNGTYVDAITGDVKNVTNGTLTAKCSGKGNLRVYVLNGPGKIGEDTKYLYNTTAGGVKALAYDGHEEDGDPTTVRDTEPYNPGNGPSIEFSPAGSAFRTETLTVTAKLNTEAATGWYKVEGGERVNLTSGASKSFTIGGDMAFGDVKKVEWSATGDDGETLTGTVSYKKVDPNAAITVYVSAPSAPNLYAWGKDSSGKSIEPCGAWPGTRLSNTTEVNGTTYYYYSFVDMTEVNVIFNNGGSQTKNIEGISSDVYYSYDGGSNATLVDGEEPNPNPNPNPTPNPTPNPDGTITIFYDNSVTNWSNVKVHYWGASETNWPGVDMTKVDGNIWSYNLPEGVIGVVFNNGNGDQTNDISNPAMGHLYKGTGNRGWEDTGVWSGWSGINTFEADDTPAEIYNLQGVRVDNPGPGIYIVVRGKKSSKLVIR